MGSRLEELSRVVTLLSAGGPAANERALTLSRTLADALSDQLALEGKLLEPALRASRAWSAPRADDLLARHLAPQGEAPRESCRADASPELTRKLLRFVLIRRADMSRAERYVLMLRDDDHEHSRAATASPRKPSV